MLMLALCRYLSADKLVQFAQDERFKSTLSATTEYSDLDDPALRRRRCGWCRRMSKVVSRVARASRQVLTQHENELSTCSDLPQSVSVHWLCFSYATDVSTSISNTDSVSWSVSRAMLAAFLIERMTKLTDEAVSPTNWEDFADSWQAVLSLRSELECKRAQDILDCICMDEKIFQALGAVEQLTKAAPMETPPTYVLTLLKNGPGSHIKARV